MKNFLKGNLLNTSQDNLVAATINLLTLLKVRVTVTAIKETISGNSNYPSLLAITESLGKWKVDAECYNITPDKLPLLPVPFIAHLRTNSGSFVAVKETSTSGVTYLKDDHAELKVPIAEFLDQWSSTVVLPEASAESGQPDFKKERNREKVVAMRAPLLLLLLIVTGAIAFTNSLHYFHAQQFALYAGLWTCATLGLIVTTLLMLYEYDNNNSYLKKFCSVGKKTNCHAVLNSTGSKVFGFSWSEIGFFYFSGAFLYLILSESSPIVFFPLILLNLIALPYIIFSIYYQAFIVKQWCTLCLTVQVILLTQFLIALFTYQRNESLFEAWKNVPSAVFLIAYFLPVSLWVIVKQQVFGAKEGEETKRRFKRFKNNAEVFNSLLLKQIPIKNNTEGLGITLGNPNAENVLIKVCNPYCGPCARSFPQLGILLACGNKWRAQIIFTAKADQNDYRALPVAHFFEIISQDGSDGNILEVLADWYNAKNKDYEAFAQKYPVTVDFERHKPKLAAMEDWCDQEDIRFTPTYYVNGRRLPENYEIEDLKDIFC
jgi:uncharacterized membrane protein